MPHRMLGALTFFLGTQASTTRSNVRPSRSFTGPRKSGVRLIHLATTEALRDAWFGEGGSCAPRQIMNQLMHHLPSTAWPQEDTLVDAWFTPGSSCARTCIEKNISCDLNIKN